MCTGKLGSLPKCLILQQHESTGAVRHKNTGAKILCFSLFINNKYDTIADTLKLQIGYSSTFVFKTLVFGFEILYFQILLEKIVNFIVFIHIVCTFQAIL